MRKNRSIKPKIRWKAKKSPGVWQGQHQTLEVQQALIGRDLTTKKAQKPRKIKVFRGFLISVSFVRLSKNLMEFDPV